MTKFKPETHIIGKVYDLTQENMNAVIKAFEEEKKENARLREKLYTARMEKQDEI